MWVIYNEIDETGAYYTEWSKSERETQILYMVLEEAEEPEIKLSTSEGSLKKQESSRKTSISAYWLSQSLWLCGSQ